MAITLTDGTTTIVLRPDLYWSDENNWHPVEQTVQRTITGALILESSSRIKGRSITLQPEAENNAWMPWSTVQALKALSAVPGKVMTLTLRGVAYAVVFRHHESPALEATPLRHLEDVQDNDRYLVTMKFMEI